MQPNTILITSDDAVLTTWISKPATRATSTPKNGVVIFISLLFKFRKGLDGR